MEDEEAGSAPSSVPSSPSKPILNIPNPSGSDRTISAAGERCAGGSNEDAGAIGEVEDPKSGRLSLAALLHNGLVEAGSGVMSIDYLGQTFRGDLLETGQIRSLETSLVFNNPSAWAIYCKKIVNPAKKSGCGWASVKYKGRKMDHYKSVWATFKSGRKSGNSVANAAAAALAAINSGAVGSSVSMTFEGPSPAAGTPLSRSGDAADQSSMSSLGLSLPTEPVLTGLVQEDHRSIPTAPLTAAPMALPTTPLSVASTTVVSNNALPATPETTTNPSENAVGAAETGPKGPDPGAPALETGGEDESCSDIEVIHEVVNSRTTASSKVVVPHHHHHQQQQLRPPAAVLQIIQPIVQHFQLGLKNMNSTDGLKDILIDVENFANLGRVQPFSVSICSSALLVADLHSHLTQRPVCGYLAGMWDLNSHNLAITHCFPALLSTAATTDPKEKMQEEALEVQKKIYQEMYDRNLSLVGWYRTAGHRSRALPSLLDSESQLENQIRMLGTSDATYTPCVGMVISPYSNPLSVESEVLVYWTLPPAPTDPSLVYPGLCEFGKPMRMSYSIVTDPCLSQEVLRQVEETIAFYQYFYHLQNGQQSSRIPFTAYYNSEVRYITKMGRSLLSKFPKDQDDLRLWKYIRILVLGEEEPEIEEDDPFLLSVNRQPPPNQHIHQQLNPIMNPAMASSAGSHHHQHRIAQQQSTVTPILISTVTAGPGGAPLIIGTTSTAAMPNASAMMMMMNGMAGSGGAKVRRRKTRESSVDEEEIDDDEENALKSTSTRTTSSSSSSSSSTVTVFRQPTTPAAAAAASAAAVRCPSPPPPEGSPTGSPEVSILLQTKPAIAAGSGAPGTSISVVPATPSSPSKPLLKGPPQTTRSPSLSSSVATIADGNKVGTSNVGGSPKKQQQQQPEPPSIIRGLTPSPPPSKEQKDLDSSSSSSSSSTGPPGNSSGPGYVLLSVPSARLGISTAAAAAAATAHPPGPEAKSPRSKGDKEEVGSGEEESDHEGRLVIQE